ncbi:protein of unknown function [Agreia sp. COWG]|nr:protein of unknown function [Agreia sp. COWG]
MTRIGPCDGWMTTSPSMKGIFTSNMRGIVRLDNITMGQMVSRQLRLPEAAGNTERLSSRRVTITFSASSTG